jgi:hypothetical protein
MQALGEIRHSFDRRLGGHVPSDASVEEPATLPEWRAFIKLCLFGPPLTKQATLHRWLLSVPSR